MRGVAAAHGLPTGAPEVLSDGANLVVHLAPAGTPADDEALAPWLALRDLHMTVWYCLYAERIPALAPRAEALLSGWRGAAGAARGARVMGQRS